MTPLQIRGVLSSPPLVVVAFRPVIDREGLNRAAIAKLSPEQRAFSDEIARQFREDAAWCPDSWVNRPKETPRS